MQVSGWHPHSFYHPTSLHHSGERAFRWEGSFERSRMILKHPLDDRELTKNRPLLLTQSRRCVLLPASSLLGDLCGICSTLESLFVVLFHSWDDTTHSLASPEDDRIARRRKIFLFHAIRHLLRDWHIEHNCVWFCTWWLMFHRPIVDKHKIKSYGIHLTSQVRMLQQRERKSIFHNNKRCSTVVWNVWKPGPTVLLKKICSDFVLKICLILLSSAK